MTEDKDFWQNFVRDVKKIPHDKVAPNNPNPRRVEVKASLTQHVSEEMSRVDNRSFGIEALSKKKKRQIVSEGTLDLHGFTRAEAERELQKFLYVSQYHGKTWVKVITGKSGILRQDVPELLQSNSSLLSGYSEARSDDGGSGAIYVRVRKGTRGRD
ncbi:MAG: Smr/MutS family protein [Holosporales bacterium]|jgi:DNA-nicking Smr family endonuclease|nr:Smr/MutS family protein [Holosporales bacterium]